MCPLLSRRQHRHHRQALRLLSIFPHLLLRPIVRLVRRRRSRYRDRQSRRPTFRSLHRPRPILRRERPHPPSSSVPIGPITRVSIRPSRCHPIRRLSRRSSRRSSFPVRRHGVVVVVVQIILSNRNRNQNQFNQQSASDDTTRVHRNETKRNETKRDYTPPVSNPGRWVTRARRRLT